MFKLILIFLIVIRTIQKLLIIIRVIIDSRDKINNLIMEIIIRIIDNREKIWVGNVYHVDSKEILPIKLNVLNVKNQEVMQKIMNYLTVKKEMIEDKIINLIMEIKIRIKVILVIVKIC